jgi:hypothetical protein
VLATKDVLFRLAPPAESLRGFGGVGGRGAISIAGLIEESLSSRTACVVTRKRLSVAFPRNLFNMGGGTVTFGLSSEAEGDCWTGGTGNTSRDA